MSFIKRVGFGNFLAVDPTGGTTFASIGSVVDGFHGPDSKAKEANTSILTDWYETSAPSSVDPGSVTFVCAYDPVDATAHTIALLLGSGAVANWQLTYSGGTPPVETFLGYVAGMSREMKREGLITMSITIRISGTPGFKTS